MKTSLGLPMDGMAMLTAVFFASFSVGRQLPTRSALRTVTLMIMLVWVALTRAPNVGVYDWVFVIMWIGGPCVGAAVYRHQLERVARLADAAARAEVEREQHARTAVLEERGRIARELHDTVAHAVSVMVLHAGAVRSRLPEGLGAEVEALGEVEETGRRAIGELRRLLGVLRDDAVDAPVEPQPTLNEVGALVEESRRLGLAVALEVDRSKPALEPAVEVTAYRILQEALTNVRKHACARSVQVRVQHDDGWLRLRVADDGIGITAGSRTGGHGLVGMRERAEVYGGRLTLTAPPDGGCVLDVALPLGSELVP